MARKPKSSNSASTLLSKPVSEQKDDYYTETQNNEVEVLRAIYNSDFSENKASSAWNVSHLFFSSARHRDPSTDMNPLSYRKQLVRHLIFVYNLMAMDRERTARR